MNKGQNDNYYIAGESIAACPMVMLPHTLPDRQSGDERVSSRSMSIAHEGGAA
jgi:hypothetical protein